MPPAHGASRLYDWQDDDDSGNDSPAAFSVTPTAGTMNRRSGDPVNVIVRFSPKQYGEPMSATLVFETEDMKKVYKFTGGTA